MSPAAPEGALGAPLAALEASGLGQAMRQWLWLYPSVETVHLVGIGLLFGSIAVFDVRLLGFSRSIAVKQLSRHVLPWTALSFLQRWHRGVNKPSCFGEPSMRLRFETRAARTTGGPSRTRPRRSRR